MSRIPGITAIFLSTALVVSVGPAAQAASTQAAPAQAYVPAAIAMSIEPDDFDAFMSGVRGHRNSMDRLEDFFARSANQLRTFANDMAPLIGSSDPNDQVELAALVGGATVAASSLRTWAARTAPSYDRACTWFVKRYAPMWSTSSERGKLRKSMASVRAAYKDYFRLGVVALADAGDALAGQDVSGFWQLLAVAEGGEAFVSADFSKAYRALLRMN